MTLSAARMPAGFGGPAIETRLLDGIDVIEADAAGVLGRDSQPSMYNRLDWLRGTARHVLPDAKLVGMRAQAGGDAAWLFLAREERRSARAFAGWYTLDVSPAFTPGMSAATRKELLKAAARALRGDFDRIDLQPVTSATADLVRSAFADAGWWVAETDATVNWVAEVAGLSFEDYWCARPSRLQNTVRRKLKGSGLEPRILRHFEAAAWNDYERVYAQSWKPEEGSPAFLRAIAEAEGQAGCLRLGLAYRQGVPVACQLWTVERGIATIHKLAYVEAEKAASPGTILSHAMFRHVMVEDRPTLIDYGNGDEPYKAEWMTRRQLTRRLSMFNQRSPGGLAGAARSAAATLIRRSRRA